MKAVGYIRVSTQEQAEEGLSLENQRSRIEAFCKAKDWQLLGIEADEGFSAKDLRRPGIQRVIELCQKGAIDVLVVYKLDRLTRSVKDLGYLIEDVFEKNEVAFSSILDNFDTTTANGRLILNILGSVAQWERDIISERTADALRHKKEQGHWLGVIPYGFRRDEAGRLIEDPEQMALIQRMKRHRRRGLSFGRLAAKYGISVGLAYKIVTTDLRTLRRSYQRNGQVGLHQRCP